VFVGLQYAKLHVEVPLAGVNRRIWIEEQADCPLVSVKVPAPQAVHVEDVVALTAVEKVPLEQAVQPSIPTPVPYVPATHERHVLLRVAPSVVEYVPAGQAVQAEARVAITVLE
jgi:hypothetical protein